ncbi:hypothetical protein Tco_0325028 [Tanacetum coccineum]
MGGAILTLVSRVKKLERTVKQLRTARLVGCCSANRRDVVFRMRFVLDGLSRMASEALGHDQATVPSEDMEAREEEEVPLRFHAPRSTDVLPQADISESAGPSVGADKGKAPMMTDWRSLCMSFSAEGCTGRKASKKNRQVLRLVQQLQAEDLAQADVPLVSEQRAKELDELLLRMTDTDWLTLMMQVGTNPALARELLGADVNEDNFIERMTAIKERKKRALADLRYRALKGKPLKHSEVTQMMRNLVKNQWCAAHNGTITMKAVKAMSKQQLIEEYENICRCLEKDRLLSAQYNLFRPKPAITEPPSKRQRVERTSSQPSHVPAATTQPADDHDSAGGSSFHPAGSAPPFSGSAAPTSAGGVFDVPDSTVPTSAAMDSAGSHRESGVSPFADSINSSSPLRFSLGQSSIVLVMVLCVPCGTKIPDVEIVDPRVKDDLFLISATFPTDLVGKTSLGCEVDDSLWDKLDEDFSVLRENRRHKNFFYLKELLPHVYREDLLLLRRRMNRPFYSDDVEDFGEHKINGMSEQLEVVIPGASVHVLELKQMGKLLTVPPSYCRDVVVAGNVIQTVQAGLRESYECLASAPLVDMVINPPWNLPFLGAKGLTSPEQTATGKGISNPLMAVMVCPKPYGDRICDFVYAVYVLFCGQRLICCLLSIMENASKGVPSAGPTTASPAEGEKKTNPTTKDADTTNLHTELVDLLGIDIVTQEVVQACPDRKEKGWKTIYGLIKTKIEYLDQTTRRLKIAFKQTLKEQNPLNELNDLADKKRKRNGDLKDYSKSTKKHKSSV